MTDDKEKKDVTENDETCSIDRPGQHVSYVTGVSHFIRYK